MRCERVCLLRLSRHLSLATGGKPSLMVIILTDSLLSRFNKLNVPLYLHPGLPLKSVQQAYFTGFSAEVNSRLSMFAWGWHHEAGIHLLRLMLSGAFDKYPHLQVICGHWGEMLPFWLQRLDDSLPLAATGLSRTLTRTFQEHVYVTPSYANTAALPVYLRVNGC